MYLLGVDIGSSSEKVAIFDYEGNLIQVVKAEYPIIDKQDGFVEQDPKCY